MNIMRVIKFGFLFDLGLLLILVFGCGKKVEETSDKVSLGLSDKPLLTEKDSVEALLNEALVRLSYRDKSGLYDLEFEYYLDERDYDTYLKDRQVQYAEMDSLDHMVLHEMIKEGDDSALVRISYIFKGPSGKVTDFPDEFYIYREYDRWKKPTASNFKKQAEYEELMRKAREAAERDG